MAQSLHFSLGFLAYWAGLMSPPIFSTLLNNGFGSNLTERSQGLDMNTMNMEMSLVEYRFANIAGKDRDWETLLEFLSILDIHSIVIDHKGSNKTLIAGDLISADEEFIVELIKSLFSRDAV